MLYLGSLSDRFCPQPSVWGIQLQSKREGEVRHVEQGIPTERTASLLSWSWDMGQCFVHLMAPMPQYSKYCTSFHPNAHFFGLSVSPVCLRDSRTGPPTAHALSRCHYGWWLHPIRQPHIQGHQRSSFRLSPCFEEVEVIYLLAPPLSKLWKHSRISIKTLKTLKNLFIYNTYT